MTEIARFSPEVEAEPESPPCPGMADLAAVPVPPIMPMPEASASPPFSAVREDGVTLPETAVSLQPPRSIALYVDGDNQSPAIARDLLASLRHDWGLEISRVAVAGNDHGQSVSRWQAALAEWLPEDRILALHVPKTPEAADLTLILELGAAMERHREGPDLVVVVSRDDWLIGAAEAVREG